MFLWSWGGGVGGGGLFWSRNGNRKTEGSNCCFVLSCETAVMNCACGLKGQGNMGQLMLIDEFWKQICSLSHNCRHSVNQKVFETSFLSAMVLSRFVYSSLTGHFCTLATASWMYKFRSEGFGNILDRRLVTSVTSRAWILQYCFTSSHYLANGTVNNESGLYGWTPRPICYLTCLVFDVQAAYFFLVLYPLP